MDTNSEFMQLPSHHEPPFPGTAMDAILNASSTGFLVLDTNLEPVYHNQVLPALLGLAGDAFDRQQILDKLELKQPGFARISRSIGLYGLWEGVYAQQDSILKVVVTALGEAPAGNYLVEVRDCTRELHQLQKIDEHNAAAAETERIRAEIVSHVSHEFKTPLHAILGYGEFVLADAALPGEHRENIEEIVSASGKLLGIVNDLLESTRGSEQKLRVNREVINLNDLVNECISLLGSWAGRKGIEFIVSASAARIYTDRIRLKHILLSLLSNAVRYNSQDGRVVLHAREEKGCLLVRITDTGPGISGKDRATLFSPARRLATSGNTVSKTGLGLMICRQLIKLLDGKVYVCSRPGMGSTFGFSLPLNLPQIVPVTSRKQVGISCLAWVENHPEAAELASAISRLYPRVACHHFPDLESLARAGIDGQDSLVIAMDSGNDVAGGEPDDATSRVKASLPALKNCSVVDVNNYGIVESLRGQFLADFQIARGSKFSLELLSDIMNGRA